MTTAEAARLLLGWDELLLLTHVRPDGDTVGSAAALCQALRDRGKTAYLLPNPELTATYAPYAAPYAAPEGFVPHHVVSVDIAALSLLPENARPYQDRIDLAIDHHPSQGFFARETCLEAESAACGEIVYNIVTLMTPLTPEIALPLYVAVSTDTGCFVYSNTTARTHRIAAAMMDCGIDVAPVNKALFRTKSRTRLAMEAWMAEVGSSNSSTSGSMHRARTMAMRCFWPPERREGYSCARSARPTRSSRAMARASAVCWDSFFSSIGARVRFFSTVMWGNRLNC